MHASGQHVLHTPLRLPPLPTRFTPRPSPSPSPPCSAWVAAGHPGGRAAEAGGGNQGGSGGGGAARGGEGGRCAPSLNDNGRLAVMPSEGAELPWIIMRS